MLLEEAAEARLLASQFDDTPSVRDLLEYASALEDEAARLPFHDARLQAGSRSPYRGPMLPAPKRHPHTFH